MANLGPVMKASACAIVQYNIQTSSICVNAILYSMDMTRPIRHTERIYYYYCIHHLCAVWWPNFDFSLLFMLFVLCTVRTDLYVCPRMFWCNDLMLKNESRTHNEYDVREAMPNHTNHTKASILLYTFRLVRLSLYFYCRPTVPTWRHIRAHTKQVNKIRADKQTVLRYVYIVQKMVGPLI